MKPNPPKPKKRMTFRSQNAFMMFNRKLDAPRQAPAADMCQAIARRVQDAAAAAGIFLTE